MFVPAAGMSTVFVRRSTHTHNRAHSSIDSTFLFILNRVPMTRRHFSCFFLLFRFRHLFSSKCIRVCRCIHRHHSHMHFSPQNCSRWLYAVPKTNARKEHKRREREMENPFYRFFLSLFLSFSASLHVRGWVPEPQNNDDVFPTPREFGTVERVDERNVNNVPDRTGSIIYTVYGLLCIVTHTSAGTVTHAFAVWPTPSECGEEWNGMRKKRRRWN